MAAVGSFFSLLCGAAIHMKAQAASGNLAGGTVKLHLDVSGSVAKPQNVFQLGRLLGDNANGSFVRYRCFQRSRVLADEKFGPDRIGSFLTVDKIAEVEGDFYRDPPELKNYLKNFSHQKSFTSLATER